MKRVASPLILCVDDDPDNRRSLAIVLRRAGYRVREAEDGMRALMFVRDVDATILDVGLPDISGFEVSRRLKANPATALVPVILVSGQFTSCEDKVEGLEEGGDVYMTKPVEPRELLGQLKALLRIRRMEEKLREIQRFEAIGQLAGGVAHEFNNLLTVVLGFADLVMSEMAPDDPQRGMIEHIRFAGERAASLTQQLLAFASKQHVQPVVVDLNVVVRELLDLLRETVDPRVTIVDQLCPEAAMIEADVGQIRQMLLNLTVNAGQAMPEGGTVTIAIQFAELPEKLLPEGMAATRNRWIVLAISDTGVGMDDKTSAHAFDPFFSTRGVGQGSGLGLAAVHGIVKQIGGFVEIESEPGAGTTFRVFLPESVASS